MRPSAPDLAGAQCQRHTSESRPSPSAAAISSPRPSRPSSSATTCRPWKRTSSSARLIKSRRLKYPASLARTSQRDTISSPSLNLGGPRMSPHGVLNTLHRLSSPLTLPQRKRRTLFSTPRQTRRKGRTLSPSPNPNGPHMSPYGVLSSPRHLPSPSPLPQGIWRSPANKLRQSLPSLSTLHRLHRSQLIGHQNKILSAF